MTNDARLEIRLPSQHRVELDRLAEQTGLSVGDLMRMAAMRLVHDDRRTFRQTGSRLMSDQAPNVPGMDPDYAAAMGRYVMAINSLPRLQKFGVVHGRRRMLGPKTPRPALDLKIVENSK